MSQLAVEQTLGRLLTDAAFRRRFFEDPSRAALLSGLTLSAEERDALLHLPQAEMTALSQRLDDRICRLCCAEELESEGADDVGAKMGHITSGDSHDGAGVTPIE
jgi:hypothetical protein